MMGNTAAMNSELIRINALLRDTSFAEEMAAHQDACYNASQGQRAAPFFSGPDSVLKKSFPEQKVAISLAGFYALECGIGVLLKQKGKTPVFWLRQIIDKTLDPADTLLLNRFANATWKTGQPFRDLNRITRGNFIVADFLGAEEIQKDEVQIAAAALLLQDSLAQVSGAVKEIQVEKVHQLMQDKRFAFAMAGHMEMAYYAGQKKPAPTFLSPAEDTAVIRKSAREEKIATNLAGFYALECGVTYLANTQHALPSDILKSIIAESLDQQNKELLERFGNATWKASQPFRSLERITRDIFMPFEFLPAQEVKKDWDQLRSAAVKLQQRL